MGENEIEHLLKQSDLLEIVRILREIETPRCNFNQDFEILKSEVIDNNRESARDGLLLIENKFPGSFR